MANKSVRELVQALPDSERRELLGRIQKSLHIDKDSNTNIYHGTTDSETRSAVARSALQKLSLWHRIVLFFRKLFSPKTEEELVVAMTLERLQAGLQQRGNELIRVEGHYVLPDFAQMCYQLYLSLLPLMRIFRAFWSDAVVLQGLVEFIIDRKVPNAKSSLFRFATFQDLQELFERYEKKDSIKKNILRYIDSYIDDIPPEVFRDIEQGILPLYYYKELVMFPFEDFFQRFQVDVLRHSDSGLPAFKATRGRQIMGELEQLYFSVYTARRAQSLTSLHDEVFEYFSTMSDKPRSNSPMLGSVHGSDQATMESDLADISDEEFENLPSRSPELSLLGTEQLKIFKDVSKAVEEFWNKSKLGDIIRVFRADPFYKFIAYSPILNVRDFYQSALRLKVLQELDEQYGNIRQQVINKKKAELFPKGVQEFEFYKRSLVGSSTTQLPIFRYVNSLQTLYQFLLYKFEREYLETFRVLSRVLPERYRDSGSRLILSIAALEELLDNIRGFDYQFSPLSEDGKSFYRLRFAAEKDISQLKTLRTVIAQRDKEVREILTHAHEALENLERILMPILSAPLDQINERFQSLSSEGEGSLKQRLKRAENELRSVKKILFYEQLMEEELVIY